MTVLGFLCCLSCGEFRNAASFCLIEAGSPAAVNFVGHVPETSRPVYALALPGVIPVAEEGVFVRAVLPGQEEAVLRIRPNSEGMYSDRQCLELLEHLDPVYDFAGSQPPDDTMDALERGETVDPAELYHLLKASLESEA